MDKLPVCRICLAKDIPMYVVVNKNLHELYEKLTDMPFITEDSRPIIACSFCVVKLKQCCRLMRKCLEAEEVFADMTFEDYELNPFTNRNHFQSSGLAKTAIECINIVDVGLTETNVVREELPAVCETLDDTIEAKEEYLIDDIKQEILDIDYTGEEVVSFEIDPEDDVPLIEVKIEELEEQEEFRLKQAVVETNRSTVVKKPQNSQDILKDTIAGKKEKNELSDPKIILKTYSRTSKPKIYSLKSNTVDTNVPSKSNQVDWSSELWENKHFADAKKKPYKCDLCQLCFSQKSHLTRHFIEHTGEKPYKCDFCQRCFSQKISLTRHVLGHTGEKPYKCDFCHRCFNHSGHLTRHIRGHTGEKPFKCEICARNFSQLSNLNRHILIHNRDKPYKCDLCQRSFTDKRDLAKHAYEHHQIGDKPYKCDFCQSSFTDMRDLAKHFHKHSGDKPYKCDICQNSFIYASDLKRHVRIHTGEKPFQCDICQRRFNVKSNLKTHIVSKHSGGNPFQM